jgi:hypothetical protein
MPSRTACLLALLGLAAGSAGAVTFDPASGTGDVAPADLQLPFGWTDVHFQERAPAVTFHYQESGSYTAVCAWPTSQGVVAQESHSQAYRWEAPVNSLLRYDPTQVRRIAGVQLLGFTPTRGAAEPLPEVGAACPGRDGVAGAWSVVTQKLESGALSARFGGVDVRLPF